MRGAPHTAESLVGEWARPYDRATAVFPAGRTAAKYWPPVARINQAYGDRNLVCTCPPPDAYSPPEPLIATRGRWRCVTTAGSGRILAWSRGAPHVDTRRRVGRSVRSTARGPGVLESIGADQIAYYRARAPWYDDVYDCAGDYDRGADLNQQWLADLQAVERALDAPLHGECVELGFRHWLLEPAGHWTEWKRLWALDSAPETQRIARSRLGVDAAKVGFRGRRPVAMDAVVRVGRSGRVFFLEHVPAKCSPACWLRSTAPYAQALRSSSPRPQPMTLSPRSRLGASTDEPSTSSSDAGAPVSSRRPSPLRGSPWGTCPAGAWCPSPRREQNENDGVQQG